MLSFSSILRYAHSMIKSLSTVIILGLIQVIILTLFGFYFYRMTHLSEKIPPPVAPVSENGS